MKFEEALLIRKRRYPSCEEATVESCLGMSTAATNSVKLAASAGIKLEPTASSAETVQFSTVRVHWSSPRADLCALLAPKH